FDIDGVLIGAVHVIRNITKRKRTEQEIRRHMDVENTLFRISEEMVKATDINKAIENALKHLGKTFHGDRAFLFRQRENKDIWSNSYEWYEKGMPSLKEKLQNLSPKNFLWWEKAIRRLRVINISDIGKLSLPAREAFRSLGIKNIKSVLVIPIKYEDSVPGIMTLTSKKEQTWSEEDIGMLQTAGEIIITSLIKDSFQKKLGRAIKEIDRDKQKMESLAKRVINAQEKERLYLASEIHDDLLQGLVATSYFLQMLGIPEEDTVFHERRKKLIKVIKHSVDRGRALISEIKPIREPEIGLIQAVHRSIDLSFAATETKINFSHPKKMPKLKLESETNIFRIIQEALMNIRKHAKAKNVSINLSTSKDNLLLEIKDDGIGFVEEEATTSALGHYGLLTMKERTILMGGEFFIDSEKNKGTTIKAIFPIKKKGKK
ncbi:MAG: GAF domain-containing sensor histidine kinase, partial [Actinomycetia bacterium]|nr:GAF domain-containing sensor histidine kinase [Actinomycetes bacterium]